MVYIKPAAAGDIILNLEVDPNCTTLRDLKIAIGRNWIIPVILQKLYMLEKPFVELEDGIFLSQFGMTPFSTLLLRGPVVIPDRLRFRAAAAAVSTNWPEKAAAADFEEKEEEEEEEPESDDDGDYDDDYDLSLSLSPMGSSEHKRRMDLRMRKRDKKKLKQDINKNKSPEFNMWRHRHADNSIWT